MAIGLSAEDDGEPLADVEGEDADAEAALVVEASVHAVVATMSATTAPARGAGHRFLTAAR